MSGFSEVEASRKLQCLDNSQSSVENTSKWFLSFRGSTKDVVKLWFREFRQASPKKKIAFLHLVNDIIQNGVAIAPQYSKLFESVLPTAFKETAKIQRHSVRAAVAHLLIVWAARHVYPRSFLRQLRFICQRAVAEADTPEGDEDMKKNIIAASPFAFSFNAVLVNSAFGDTSQPAVTTPGVAPQTHSDRSGKRRKHKHPPVPLSSLSFDPGAPTNMIMCVQEGEPETSDLDSREISLSAFREELTRELQIDALEPLETAEFIKLLESLQSAASGDAATRRAIAEFPPEVSDTNRVLEIAAQATEEEKAALIERITECSKQLDSYNCELDSEFSQRSQLVHHLRAYRKWIKEQIHQTKARREVLKAKMDYAESLREELKKHDSSLPDLHLLPDVTSALEPLPTVGDLFG